MSHIRSAYGEAALLLYLADSRFVWASDHVQDITNPTYLLEGVRRTISEMGVSPAATSGPHLGVVPWSAIEALPRLAAGLSRMGTARSSTDAAAWQQFRSFMIGNWRCTGVSRTGRKIEGAVRAVSAIGDKWLRFEHIDEPPGPYAAEGMWGIQRGTGRLIATLHDNFSGARRFDGTITPRELTFVVDPTFSVVPTLERFRYIREEDSLRIIWELAPQGAWQMGDDQLCTRTQ